MGEPFSTASTYTSVRPTEPLVADRGSQLLLPFPSWILSAAPKGRGCGGRIPFLADTQFTPAFAIEMVPSACADCP
jgi:hypothetical protein